MKRCVLLLLWTTASAILADDIKTTGGKVYKNVTVSRVEPDGIMVVTDSGISKIYFTELPRELQEQYKYDPKQAATFRADLDTASALAQKENEAAKEKRRQEFIKNDSATIEAEKAARGKAQEYHNPLNNSPVSRWAINGKVLSVTDEGAIIYCTHRGFGMTSPEIGEVVFIQGKQAADLVDDEKIRCTGTPSGTFRYVSAGGAAKTVRSLLSPILRKCLRSALVLRLGSDCRANGGIRRINWRNFEHRNEALAVLPAVGALRLGMTF